MRSASISTRTKLRPSGVELVAADRQQQRFLRGGVELRIVERRARPAGRRRRGSRAASICDHCGSALLLAARARTPLRRRVGRWWRARPWRGALTARRFSCASSSACAVASTSRFRIFAAPATARSATAVAQLLLRARDLLLDLGLGGGDDAVGFGLRVDLRLLDRLGLELLADRDDLGRPRLGFAPAFPRRASRRCASSLRPCSPAARPSAICFWRVSMARISGGQMKRAQNQMKAANATACMISVRLKFMACLVRVRDCDAALLGTDARAAGWRTRRTSRGRRR